MGGFDDFSTATKIRDLVTKIAEDTVERLRPRYRYATVTEIDSVNNKAKVQFPGESTTVTVGMGAIRPAAVGARVRIHGVQGERYIADVVSGTAAGLSESITAARLSQQIIMAPGNGSAASPAPARWNGTHLRWDGRILAIAAGRGSKWSTDGYYAFTLPAVGTVIGGTAGIGDQTVTANGIPIPVHTALYAIPTLGGGASAYYYTLWHYTAGSLIPSENAILIAARTENSPALRTGWGDTIYPWVEMTAASGVLQSQVTPYQTGLGNPWTPRYCKINGIVFLEGLLNVPGSAWHTFQLPAGFRPYDGAHMSMHMCSGPGYRRLDINHEGNGFFHEGVGYVAGGWHSIQTSFPADR